MAQASLDARGCDFIACTGERYYSFLGGYRTCRSCYEVAREDIKDAEIAMYIIHREFDGEPGAFELSVQSCRGGLDTIRHRVAAASHYLLRGREGLLALLNSLSDSVCQAKLLEMLVQVVKARAVITTRADN